MNAYGQPSLPSRFDCDYLSGRNRTDSMIDLKETVIEWCLGALAQTFASEPTGSFFSLVVLGHDVKFHSHFPSL